MQKVFRKLFGKPCWNVMHGYSSFLAFEFGKPHLEIQGPRSTRRALSPRVRQFLSRRHVMVHGDWHLWIYCCHWSILQNGKRLATSSSKPTQIAYAATQLQGQALINVSVDPNRGSSRFKFDFGGELETRKFDNSSEQWLLYDPSKRVLSMRPDGQFSYCRETLPG